MAQPQGFMPVSDGAAPRTPTQPLSSRPGMHERQKSYRGVGPSLPTAVRSPSSTRPGRSNTATEQPQIGPDGQPVRQNSGSTTVRRPSIIGGSRRAVIGVGDLVRAGSRLLGGSAASLTPEQEEHNRAAALENAKKKVSHFTQQDYKDTLSELGVNPHLGLSSKEAAARLAIHGLNELEKEPPKPFWKLLLEQFQDILVILLILAAIAALVLGEYAASTVIILIVIANAALGVVQEQRAGAALDALKNTCAAKAQVIRDGTPQDVEASQLVPGDIIRLELGAQVPADLRLIDTQGLAALEAALTGEPDGIKKDCNHISKGEHKEEKSAAPATTDGKAPEAKKEEKKDDSHEDEKNMVFFGCTIVEGRGAGVVVKTGMKTKMGEIQHLLNTADDKESPLETKLDALGQRLGIASILISVVVLVIGVTTGRGVEHNSGQPEWLQMLLVAVSLTVAAVPEGLPACVTITLAIGMRRMVQKNAIIRNLHSVETLGSASVICSDKTGTLTAGAMTAVRLWIGGQIFRITGAGYEPYGEIIPIDTNADDKEAVRAAGEQIKKKRAPLFPLLVAMLSSNAEEPVFNQKDKKWESTGNASERPLVVAAVKGGLKKSDLSKIFKREREHTFNSARKMMSVFVSTSGDDAGFPELKGTPYFAAVKGAPNIVMENCVDMLQLNESGEGYTRKNMDDGDRKKILDAIDSFSEQAFRVLAIAYRRMDDRPANLEDPNSLEKSGLTLCGLVASIDPEREAVKPSIHKAHNAGIRVVMITGDYVKTAKAIAENIDIFPKGSPAAKAIDCKLIRDFGEELDGYRDALANDKINKEERQVILGKEKAAMEKLDAITKYVDVYARAKPADKITIVRSLQRQGNVCSMTGDGVNDAPALKQANIGVAMGITGTDVAKNAADMVLTDDNFVSIVEAVEEGRTIYANITKFVFYLLSTNVGEVFVILIAVIIGLPSPLAPIQILWLNLTTDGAPAIALAVEATEPGTMDQGPRLLSEPLLEKVMLTGIFLNMTLLTLIVLCVYIVGLYWHTGIWMQAEDLSMDNKQSICDKINSDRISATPPVTPFANYDACFASNEYRSKEKDKIELCLQQARTMAILTIVFCELGRAYTARSLRVSIFTMGVFSNKWMQYACGTAVLGTLCVVLIPGLNDVVFDTTYIDGRDWGLVIGISILPMLWDEFLKAIYRCTGFGKRPRAKFGGSEAKAPDILTGGNAEKKEDINVLTLEAGSDQKATTKSDKDIEMGRV